MISERDLLDRFEDFKRRRDDEWMAICPAHDDRNPSLHLTLTGDRWLLKCHAGCETEDVLAAIGLDWGDLFPARVNGRGEEVTAYSYTDEHGEPLFEVVRLWPKGFYQRRPNGEKPPPGRKPMDGVRRVLYRLPKVIDAIKAGMTIWIAAGEKDVHALERAGVVATCNPMGEGEGSWLRDYSETLRGAEVVIVVDRDKEGRAHGRRVVEALDGVAASVKPVESVAGKDAYDHLTAAKMIDQFVPVDLEAKRDTAAPAQALEALWDMETALVEAEQPLPYLIHPLAVRGFATELVAKHSSFKSWLMICLASRCHQLALRGASEPEDFAGLTCHPARALYVDAENGRRLMGRRFKAAEIPADGLLVADGSYFPLLKKIDDLKALIRATGADLVVIDSLRRVTPGADEDSSRDMAPVVAALGQLARELDVAVVFIHHQSSKPGAPPSRGSSAIEDQADAVLRLRRHPGNRLKLWVGAGGKFRMDEEPAPIWISMGSLGGVFAAAVAEPIDDEDEAGDEGSTGVAILSEDHLVEKINRLALAVDAEGGWAPGRLAGAVSSDPKSGTWNRALGVVLENGSWIGTGKGPARRLRPSPDFVRKCHKDVAKHRQPLGDGDIGDIGDIPEGDDQLDREAPEDFVQERHKGQIGALTSETTSGGSGDSRPAREADEVGREKPS